MAEDRLRDLRRIEQKHTSMYYNPDKAAEAFIRMTQSPEGSQDDLDDILYYLLNSFSSDDIKARLKLAAEVHQVEVARRVFQVPPEKEDEEAEGIEDLAERRGRPLTKKEQALKDLGF